MVFTGRMKQKIKDIKIMVENITVKSWRRQFLNDKTFSIISNNCWGGLLYQYFGLKYTSPFVGLFLFSKDYLKLLENLNYYMETELVFIECKKTKYKNELIDFGIYEKYPIGMLRDIEIHFLHFGNKEIAAEKWERRKKRINYDNLIVKYCDQNLATVDDIKKFSTLEYTKKVVLTAKKYPYKCNIKLNNEDGKYVNNDWRNFIKTVNIIKNGNGENLLTWSLLYKTFIWAGKMPYADGMFYSICTKHIEVLTSKNNKKFIT